ncbi:MAG: translation initiation factor [Isosphaeraceae bacterium]|nr:translation initiation factor [Isosphaeraceae bacterium]
MQRLFSGTKWDRPPVCERCGLLESECKCPPPVVEPTRIPPENQTARIRVEKRAKGKIVTTVSGLDADGNDLPALAATLKTKCGAGGSLVEGVVEIQGNHLDRIAAVLAEIGYKVKRIG